MDNQALGDLLTATWQTVYMVYISSYLSIFFGLCMGILLFVTQKTQWLKNRAVNRALGAVVNVLRSIPFIILMILVIPLTRLLVGTFIGTNAAIVPLTIAAIPFFARVAEAALGEVHAGLLEAGRSMGATHRQITLKVLLPEAMPSLVKGATLTIITLVGYSAMAGAIGGGGLGELAYNYGYQRFDVVVMLETVVILVVIVQAVQSFGDYVSAKPRIRKLLILATLVLSGLIVVDVWPSESSDGRDTVTLGVMGGEDQKIMEVAQKVAEEQFDFNLKLVPFSDYILPNTALNNGEIDANLFQHVPYLDSQLKARGYQLTPIAKSFIYPMGFFSKKIKALSELSEGATVAIPNDPSNEGRALLLLEKHHLIELKKGAGLFGTVADIVENPRHLKFKELDAASLPRVLPDVELVALTNNFVKPAGFTLNQALVKEGPDSPYANVLVVRTQDEHRPIFKELIQVIHSKPVQDAVLKAFPDGAAIPAWKASGQK